MTREEIMAMPAGPEMDRLVATEIMAAFSGGFPTGQPTTVFPPYSTDERAASELLARTTTGNPSSPSPGGRGPG